MAFSEKYEISRNLVLAYRTWAEEAKATLQRPDSIVFMDDLSNIARDGQRVDWRKEFAMASATKNVFNEAELLKVKQSIAFLEFLAMPPTKAAVLACGGEFDLISEAEIARLKDEVSLLEQGQSADDIDTFVPPLQFVDDLVACGLRFLREKMPWLQDISTKISYINPESPFGAQVITDQNGDIVCELRVPERLTAKFIDTLIHELLGHVLHFTQLKHNRDIQNTCPHLLCLTLHTHEPFFIEGVAQLLSLKLLKSNWMLRGKSKVLLENAKFRRTMAIVSFVLSKVLDGSVLASEAGKLHGSYSAEQGELERFERVYAQTLKDLFITKIRLNYHQSFMALQPLLELKEDRFFGVMRPLLTNYYTPTALRNFVGECLA